MTDADLQQAMSEVARCASSHLVDHARAMALGPERALQALMISAASLATTYTEPENSEAAYHDLRVWLDQAIDHARAARRRGAH